MNQKLQQIFQSYLLGKVQSISKIENIDLVLEQQKKTTIMAHLPLEYLITIKQLRNINKLALAALFHDKIPEAKQAYATINKIIRYSTLNYETSLIIKDEFSASKGYLNYRQGNYESARANIQIALESCMALINQYNYGFLQARSIHLACNIVKVEACSGNKEKAMKIACYLISNIEGNCDNSLYKDIDLLKPVQHLSFKNESFLLTQVFEEVAKLFASCERSKSNKLVDLATNLLGERNLSSNEQFYREHTWLENKKVLAEGKTVELLEKASEFLADGRGSCKLLWHATVLDVLKISQNIDSEISKKLQRQITEDFSKFKYLPGVLKV